MSKVVRAIAVLTAVVVAVLTPGPAVAAPEDFNPIPCFSGAIDATAPTDDYLELRGHLDCASGATDGTFGVAHYYSEAGGYAAMFRFTLRSYGSGAPTGFAVGNAVEGGTRNFGLCVVTDYDVRVACVRVTREKEASVVATTPLATDDPLVNRRVGGVIVSPGIPVCGYCW